MAETGVRVKIIYGGGLLGAIMTGLCLLLLALGTFTVFTAWTMFQPGVRATERDLLSFFAFTVVWLTLVVGTGLLAIIFRRAPVQLEIPADLVRALAQQTVDVRAAAEAAPTGTPAPSKPNPEPAYQFKPS